jgi:hypothetical protein
LREEDPCAQSVGGFILVLFQHLEEHIHAFFSLLLVAEHQTDAFFWALKTLRNQIQKVIEIVELGKSWDETQT